MQDSNKIWVDDFYNGEVKVIKRMNGSEIKEYVTTPYMEDLAKSMVDDLLIAIKKGVKVDEVIKLNSQEFSFNVIESIYNFVLREIDLFKGLKYGKKYVLEQVIYSDEWVAKVYEENNNFVDWVDVFLPVGLYYSICTELLNRLYID